MGTDIHVIDPRWSPTSLAPTHLGHGIAVAPGGRALKFYASVRLDIRRVEQIKDGTERTGNRTRVKVAKNKRARRFRTAEFDIIYGTGIFREGSIFDVATDLGVVKKSGAWYTCESEQLGQGRENAKQFLHDAR